MAIFSFWLTPAQAAECHAALVLALDASDSVDPAEAELQRDGVAAALRDPVVQAAISPYPGLGAALRVFEWSDPGETLDLARWTFIASIEDAAALADRIDAVPTTYLNGQTGIGAAMEYAAAEFDKAPLRCARRIIDVSGDGPGNTGPTPDLYRRLGTFEGITINGLVIRHPDFDSAQPPNRDPLPYYMEKVRHGPGAFVEIAATYEDYAAAIRRKLLRELTPSLASAEALRP